MSCVAVTPPCDPTGAFKGPFVPLGYRCKRNRFKHIWSWKKNKWHVFFRPGPTLWESAPKTWSTWLRLAKTAGRSAQPTLTASAAGTNTFMLPWILYFYREVHYNRIHWFWLFWESGECWPGIMAANLNPFLFYELFRLHLASMIMSNSVKRQLWISCWYIFNESAWT